MPKRKLAELSSPEKNKLGDDILNKEESYASALQQYDGGLRTLEKWVSCRRKGLWIHSKPCRPYKIDSDIEKQVFGNSSKKRLSDTSNQFIDKVRHAVELTCEKRGTSSSKELESLSRHTVKKIENRNDIVTKTAEVGTQARIDGCNDKYHVISYAGLNYWAWRNLQYEGLRCNADGTCYTVGYEIKKKTC